MTITGSAQTFSRNANGLDAGHRLTYRWCVGGAAVVGAATTRFTPGVAHVGKPVTVQIAGTLADYTTIARKSATTSKVR